MGNTKVKVRCEGMRRRGGAFSLGIPQWEQCKENAVYMIRIKQLGEEGTQEFPACQTCLDECQDTKGIDVLEMVPA